MIQEIFGLNSHIRDVTRRWASLGFEAVAPALFDPVEKNVELGYSADVIPRARELVQKLGWERALDGVRRGVELLKERHQDVFVVGYCWGGSLAYLSACRLQGIRKASAYYGRQIATDFPHDDPKVPMMFHFGRKDPSIPPENVEAVRAQHPQLPLFVYEAGHGFNCDQRPDFDEPSSKLAEERTLAFFLE